MKAPYTAFGKTKMVEIVTYTNGERDVPPKSTWNKDWWVERDEDWYALENADFAKGTIRIIERDKWLRTKDRVVPA